MKLTKILEQILPETGDTTNVKTYSTKKTYDTVDPYSEVNKVTFTTDSKTDYFIVLDKIDYNEDNTWWLTVEFAAKTLGSTKFNSKAVVNKGELYKVMATVVQEILKEIEESKQKDQYIGSILIEPSKNFQQDSRRSNLYMAYIKKNMPAGSTVTMSDDFEEIKVLLP